MDLIQAIILGFIQGTTEWLPISSTGHLRIAEQIFGLALPLLFDVALHMGTLAVVLFFFRKDIKRVVAALAKGDFRSENGRLVLLVIVGTIPTILIGGIFGSIIEMYLNSNLTIACAFLACGVVLYFSKTGTEQNENITYMTALAIGSAQGIALVPGISRSGLTIATALLLGARRDRAFKFSFLVYIPAVIGALGFTLYKQYTTIALIGVDWTDIFVGITVSLIVSYFALKALCKVLIDKKFYLFAFYCWFIGAVLLALSIENF